MAQILCMGASGMYGVGGPRGGWADLIKLHLHQRMYAGDGGAEAHEVHIFAKPDATVEFVQATYAHCIADYRRKERKTIGVLSIGMNDTKAIDSPDSFLSTPEDYNGSMRELLRGLQNLTDTTLCVGFSLVDEAKTSPKRNPFTGKDSYFSNERIRLFNHAFAQTAAEVGMPFVNLLEHIPEDWTSQYLFADGVHPNDRGHQWIFEQVLPALERLIG